MNDDARKNLRNLLAGKPTGVEEPEDFGAMTPEESMFDGAQQQPGFEALQATLKILLDRGFITAHPALGSGAPDDDGRVWSVEEALAVLIYDENYRQGWKLAPR